MPSSSFRLSFENYKLLNSTSNCIKEDVEGKIDISWLTYISFECKTVNTYFQDLIINFCFDGVSTLSTRSRQSSGNEWCYHRRFYFISLTLQRRWNFVFQVILKLLTLHKVEMFFKFSLLYYTYLLTLGS